ncbi:MAG: MmgE/PrpD family protein [Burkholderiales bacterium]|nr:MmgE/PrpD family protein [Burkholderiales bacterium]
MDETTRTLANYVTGLTYDDLPPGAVHETKKRLVDAIACAIGGFKSVPSEIARRIASRIGGEPPARVIGTGRRTSMEMAAFVNSVMVRYLDFNDTYISKGSGHPSDMMPAILAVAEAHRASGRDALLGIAVAYEVYAALGDEIALRDLGWDQGVFAVLGSAAGAAKVLDLDARQTGDALAIAVTANIPTRQTRAGELSMWKGVATAAAARAGVTAALLAREGMTGPTAAFEGKDGVWEKVTGKFRLGPMGGNGKGFGIERTNIKFFPSEYHSQAPLWIALELRRKVAVPEIEAINVQTYFSAWSEIGSEPQKWNPQTRETADHSMPYLLALGLIDGRITVNSFSAERMRDPAVRDLMNRIRIAENRDFTGQYPGRLMTQIEVITKSGRRIVESAQYPRGHAKNPMPDEDVNSKFGTMCEGLVGTARRDALLTTLWSLDQAADLTGLFDLLVFE